MVAKTHGQKETVMQQQIIVAVYPPPEQGLPFVVVTIAPDVEVAGAIGFATRREADAAARQIIEAAAMRFSESNGSKN